MPPLTCPTCHAALSPTERYGTESIVCAQCRSIVGVAGGQVRLIGPQGDRARGLGESAPLPLGSRGRLRGKALEVTGVIVREEGDYRWHELALADENGDITWLWVDRGHFSLLACEGPHCVSMNDSREYVYGGHTLRLFGRGKADFVAAAGEFPFPIDPAEHPLITDYVAPPYVASFESKVWWVFEYVPVHEIVAAFGVECEAPSGVGCNQPAPYQRQRIALAVVTLAALVLAAVIHVAFGRNASDVPVVAATVDLRDPKNANPQSFGPFKLERRWNSLDVVVSSPVDNAWADLTLALVNEQTGRSYWTSHGVEFYRGWDSDGAWSEGSSSRSTLVRSIPAGTYTLLAHGETGTWSTGAPPHTAMVQIYDRPSPASNLLLAVGLILAIAGGYVWLGYRFEAARWEQSDFDPHKDNE